MRFLVLITAGLLMSCAYGPIQTGAHRYRMAVRIETTEQEAADEANDVAAKTCQRLGLLAATQRQVGASSSRVIMTFECFEPVNPDLIE
jgi:hypothetical protein